MQLLLKKILGLLARKMIKRYQPTVIGITGSVGKTTAKEAINAIIRHHSTVRATYKNKNNEFGVPLAVIGIIPPVSIISKIIFPFRLLWVFWSAFGFIRVSYPKLLVLELAADKPGDIEYLSNIVRPNISIVTAIGEIPVHVDYYANPEAVAREKSILIKNLSSDGFAVLNYDDETVREMHTLTKANYITFGFAKEASIRAQDVQYFIDENNDAIGGLSFTINTPSFSQPAILRGVVGPQQIYAVLAATAVALHLGMQLADVVVAFDEIDFPAGRMKIFKGIQNTILIDDTYNASPLSTHAALDSLSKFSKALSHVRNKPIRRIAILSDMLELGKYARQAHASIGDFASETSDVLFTYGNLGCFIADSAKNKLSSGKVRHYYDQRVLIDDLKAMLQKDDVILIKGSQSMRMERVVKALLADMDDISLLVRQDGEWKEREDPAS